MAILERIENYLDDMHAPFARRSHAQIEQISGRKLAKTVVLLVDGGFAMAVLPADGAIDLQELAGSLGA